MHVFNMITAPNFFPGDTIPYGAIEVKAPDQHFALLQASLPGTFA